MLSFNHEQYIGTAIRSVLSQSYTDFELIIIDDASNDNSPLVIKEFATKDTRIKPIFHEKNLGIAKSLNEGIDVAEGTFIALIGSDDVWSIEKLERQIAELVKNENLLVWSEGLIIDQGGISSGEYFTRLHQVRERKKSGYIFEDLLWGNFILGSSLVFKKQNLGTTRFNEELKYLNDHQFFIDMAKKYPYLYIDTPLVQYRIHGHNTIIKDKEGHFRDLPKLFRYVLETYGDGIRNDIKIYIFQYTVDALNEIITSRETEIGSLHHTIKQIPELEGRISDLNKHLGELITYAKSQQSAVQMKDKQIGKLKNQIRDDKQYFDDLVAKQQARILELDQHLTEKIAYTEILESKTLKQQARIVELDQHLTEKIAYTEILESKTRKQQDSIKNLEQVKQEKISRIQDLENEVHQLHESVMYRVTLAFHVNFIERFFPQGTRPRMLYNRFLRRIRSVF